MSSNRRQNVFASPLLCMFVLVCAFARSSAGQDPDLPNILWLVSEDNSPLVGAYGDDFATTPYIDQLAGEAFLYTHAYANAPVCAPSRNTIITGMYATSGGHQHQRSTYRTSDDIALLPELLRKAGYYTTNNDKEDYNLPPEQTTRIWDESSETAHYRNRQQGQPFFAVFNNHQSHEYTVHRWKPLDELRHDPDAVTLPPYHPDTPEIRRDWAQYYDSIENMDAWVGRMLDELEESGEADNTIVFYFADHGGVLPRSKRFVYETGTRVPLLVRIPEKFRHLRPSDRSAGRVDRLVGLVDLAPTLLNIIGADVPGWMHGAAFLGKEIPPPPEYVYMFRGRMDEKFDMSRAVRDERFRYIRNYMPYRIYGQHLEYLWQAASIRSWEETCRRGACDDLQDAHWRPKPAEELYDTASDPWEVNNLAADPAYRDVLERLRDAHREWVLTTKDAGFIPEADLVERAADMPIYEYMRSGNVPLESIFEAAQRATSDEAEMPVMRKDLHSDDSAIRYWGATGLLLSGDDVARSDLEHALSDVSPSVTVVAAEALYRLGDRRRARDGFKRALRSANSMARTHALNAIESVGDGSAEIREVVIEIAQAAGLMTRDRYDHRSMKRLLDLWGVDAAEHGIEFAW